MVCLVRYQLHSAPTSHTHATLGMNLSETLQVNVLHLVLMEVALYLDQCQIVKVSMPHSFAVTQQPNYQMRGHMFGVIMTSLRLRLNSNIRPFKIY